MTRTRPLFAPLLALLVLCSAGCSTTPECGENLPNGGVVRTSRELFELTQHAVKNECWEVVYEAMSKKTRGEYSYLEMWAGLKWLKVPAPWCYRVTSIVANGEFVDVWPGPKGQELVLVQYKEPSRPELLAQILVVEEQDDEGRKVKRLALVEQKERGPAINQEPPPDATSKDCD